MKPLSSSLLILFTWLLLIALPGSVVGQSITIETAIENAVSRSSSLRQSQLRIASSRLREIDVLESARPRFSFISDPVYGLVTQRIPGVDSSPVQPATEPSTLLINSTSAGISITQPLPTAGVVSGSLRGGFSISSDFPDDGDVSNTFSLEPSLAISVSQPLFVDGKFIDTEQDVLAYEQAQRATKELAISAELVRRETTASVIALYTQLGTLRRAVMLQNAQRELLSKQLEQAEIRRSSGQASRQDELVLQVQINRLDDARLRSELAIGELELQLAKITGLSFGPDTELEPIADLSERADRSLAASLSGITIEKRAVDVTLRRAETDLRLARKQPKATANAALSITPRYADQRQREDQLWGSVADYFDDGGGVDIALSLGLSVPLREANSRDRAIRQAEIAVDLAREELKNTAEDAEHQQRLFELRIKNLADRIELLQFELGFEKSQLESELELVDLGVSTDADVDAVRSDILTAEIELEDLVSQLFLARMDLAAARGLDLGAIISAD